MSPKTRGGNCSLSVGQVQKGERGGGRERRGSACGEDFTEETCFLPCLSLHHACFFLNARRQVTYYGSANLKFTSASDQRNEKKKKELVPFLSPLHFSRPARQPTGKYIFENCSQIRPNYTRRSHTPAFKSRL